MVVLRNTWSLARGQRLGGGMQKRTGSVFLETTKGCCWGIYGVLVSCGRKCVQSVRNVISGDCAESDGGGGCDQHQTGQRWQQVMLPAVMFSSCCLLPLQHDCGMMLTTSPTPAFLGFAAGSSWWFFTGTFQPAAGCSGPQGGHRWQGKFYHRRSKTGLDLVICFPPSASLSNRHHSSLAGMHLWSRAKLLKKGQFNHPFLFSYLSAVEYLKWVTVLMTFKWPGLR